MWPCAGSFAEVPDLARPRVRLPSSHGKQDPATARCPAALRMRPVDRALIRASKTTAVRYERAASGRTGPHGCQEDRPDPRGRWLASPWTPGISRYLGHKKAKTGYDFVHSVVDDHSRFAYSEILADETAATTVGFFSRALNAFARLGVTVKRS